MKKNLPTKLTQPVPGFFLHVDGKSYGPYKSRFQDRITRLLHLKGVTVEHVMVAPSNLLPVPKKRQHKPENLSLLDGLDWKPCRREF